MATNYDDDDDYDFQEEVKEEKSNPLRKVNKALEKRLKELEAENQAFKSQVRQRTVKDVLTSKGVKPSIAKYIPENVVSEDEINEWLIENAEDFNITFTEGKAEEKSSNAKANPALQAQQRINDIVATGQAPAYDEDIAARISDPNLTRSQLDALLGVNSN